MSFQGTREHIHELYGFQDKEITIFSKLFEITFTEKSERPFELFPRFALNESKTYVFLYYYWLALA